MDCDPRLSYLGTIPHSQRSIVLLGAAMVLMQPHGSALVQELRRRHPTLDGQQFCIQALLDLMMSIAGKWHDGSVVLLPVAMSIGVNLNDVVEEMGTVCPSALTEQMWDLIERLHHEAEPALADATREPSCN